LFHKLKLLIQSKSKSRFAQPLLGFIAFIESIFFPIPPDLLLLPICFFNRNKIFFSIINCTLFSVLGGCVAYFLGFFLYESIVIYLDESKITKYIDFYNNWGVLSVLIGGFTPIPFKVITITSGFMKFDFTLFIASSIFARGLRFLIVGLIIKYFSEKGFYFLNKYKLYIFVLLPFLIIILIIKIMK